MDAFNIKMSTYLLCIVYSIENPAFSQNLEILKTYSFLFIKEQLMNNLCVPGTVLGSDPLLHLSFQVVEEK